MEYDKDCACGHKRKQHSFNGCTWVNPDDKKDKCNCTETYMNQNPHFRKEFNREGHAWY